MGAVELWPRGARVSAIPTKFFGDPQIADLRWVTFTVTTTGSEFVEQITKLLGGASRDAAGFRP